MSNVIARVLFPENIVESEQGMESAPFSVWTIEGALLVAFEPPITAPQMVELRQLLGDRPTNEEALAVLHGSAEDWQCKLSIHTGHAIAEWQKYVGKYARPADPMSDLSITRNASADSSRARSGNRRGSMLTLGIEQKLPLGIA